MVQSVSGGKGRMAYIDALRGVSILLVVFHHIINKMGPVMALPGALTVRDCLASFRMPLFFFVSGFFAYRMASSWTPAKIRSVMSKKICAQIIGTIVFAATYFYCFNQNVLAQLVTLGSTRYWFTIALFQMFVVYLAVSLVTRRSPSGLFTVVMLLLTVAGFAANLWVTREHDCIEVCNDFDAYAWGKLTYFFPFFVLGIFTRRAGDRVWKFLFSPIVITLLVLLFAGSQYFILDMNYTTVGKLLHLIPGVSGVLCMLAFFHKHRDYFDGEGKGAKALCFIGRRTLDIYFLHYFFIPDIAYIPLTFYLTNPVVPLLLVGFVATACVTALSLVVSGILRLSPVLAYILFGAGQFIPKQKRSGETK